MPGICQPRAVRFVASASLVCLIAAGCGGADRTATHAAGHRTPAATPGNAETPANAGTPGNAVTPGNGPVVLGSKNFIVWGGVGFGTAHPTKIVVGSDPSVIITGIRWHGWGRRTASGVGSYHVPHFGHGGNYYRKRFRADLRVSGIGRCHPSGPRAYMALKVRLALQPGQRPSWYEADGSHGLCSYP
jgi:hypothetical protein